MAISNTSEEALNAYLLNLQQQKSSQKNEAVNIPQQQISPVALGCGGFSMILQVALVIIASLGLAGVISPTAMGGTIVGLCVANLIALVAASLAADKCGQAACPAVIQIALIVISALAISGIVAPNVAAWCILGPAIVGAIITCCVGSCAAGLFVCMKDSFSNPQ